MGGRPGSIGVHCPLSSPDLHQVLALVSIILSQVAARTVELADEPVPSQGGTKMFGGGKAPRTDYRYNVVIELRGTSVCGGSLVAEEWVLTAARCLASEPRLRLYRLVIGDYNKAKEGNEFKVKPAEFVIHPDFDTSTQVSNLALVRLARAAPVQRRNIALVPSLATSGLADSDLTDTSVYQCGMSGWGKKLDSSDQKKLQVFPVTVELGCPPSLVPDPATQLCYNPAPAGPCKGDIGNPVLCVESNVEIQVGINLGESCTTGVAPATRLSTFATWITSVIKPGLTTLTPPIVSTTIPPTTPTPVCPPFSAPANGQVTYTGLGAGDTAQILCDAAARLSVYHSCNAQSTCLADGTWSPDITGVTCDLVCDSAGTSFMFGFLDNIYSEGDGYLYIVASGPTRLTIEIPFLYNDPRDLGEITDYLSVQFNASLGLSDISAIDVSNKGVRLTASQPITVYVHSYRPGHGPSADGTLVMPENCLSTSYLVVSHNKGGLSSFGSAIVVATTDNTVVTISDGFDYDIAMQAFDTYEILDFDLSGTSVSASKNIAVISGHKCASVPDDTVTRCDHLVEHVPPVSSLGTAYIGTIFRPRPNFSLRIIATVSDTEVTMRDIAGTIIFVVTLDAMQVYYRIFEERSFTRLNAPRYPVFSITATKPILVAQYGHGSSSDNLGFGDPSMLILPALNQFRSSYHVYAPDYSLYNQNWTAIILPECYGIGGLLIDNVPVSLDVAEVTSITVPGIGEYLVVHLQIGSSDVRITHADGMGLGANFGVIQYGFSNLVEYSWAAGRVF